MIRDRLARHYHSHKRTFSRATVTSIAATAVDFTTLYVLVEFGHAYYVWANATAALLGALTNFTLNRHWAFESRERGVHIQSFRYALVSGASLVLNTALVFCFTEFAGLRYLVSKVIASVTVGWGWNYPLHRYFVFSKPRPQA